MNTTPTTATPPTIAIPTYHTFWACFEPAAKALLTEIATGVTRLSETTVEVESTSDESSDEYGVTLTFSEKGTKVIDLTLILKDAMTYDEEPGVGVGVEMYDHRENFMRIDGILQNFTAEVWKLTTQDLEAAVARIDVTDMTNQVLLALRGQKLLAL